MAETTTPTASDDDEARKKAREHMRAARAEFRESMNSFLPPEFFQHQRNARREMLLAWRSMIDRALQRLEEKKTGSEL